MPDGAIRRDYASITAERGIITLLCNIKRLWRRGRDSNSPPKPLIFHWKRVEVISGSTIGSTKARAVYWISPLDHRADASSCREIDVAIFHECIPNSVINRACVNAQG